jgi:hypothetical protein
MKSHYESRYGLRLIFKHGTCQQFEDTFLCNDGDPFLAVFLYALATLLGSCMQNIPTPGAMLKCCKESYEREQMKM